MSKSEFIDQLAQLLADISPEEREEALAYYREYIEDGDLEDDEKILRELGSPAEIAKEIKAGLLNKGIAQQTSGREYTSDRDNPQNSESAQNTEFSRNKQSAQSTDSTGMVIALVALVLLSPFWLPLLLSIVTALFGLLVGGVVGGIACIIVGIVLMVIGIVKLFSLSTLLGFSLLGAGMLVTAIGILFLILGIWICSVAVPWCIKGIGQLFSKLSNHKEAHV